MAREPRPPSFDREWTELVDRVSALELREPPGASDPRAATPAPAAVSTPPIGLSVVQQVEVAIDDTDRKIIGVTIPASAPRRWVFTAVWPFYVIGAENTWIGCYLFVDDADYLDPKFNHYLSVPKEDPAGVLSGARSPIAVSTGIAVFEAGEHSLSLWAGAPAYGAPAITTGVESYASLSLIAVSEPSVE